MARSRMIKPEFWSDEKMATISRDARLTYIGMWNLSDDYGVVKGNPMWLKNNIYPYEEISQEVFRGWLNELMRLKRIVPFEVNSEGFYLIRNFLKHQTINRPSQTRNPTPPDTLTTDSLNAHDILIDETEYKQSINRVKTETETATRPRPEKDSCPISKIIGLYHDTLPELATVIKISQELSKKIRTRWNADKDRQSLDWWRWYFEGVRKCGFLMGQKKDWAATLHWLTGRENMEKVLSGYYLDRNRTTTAIEEFLHESA